MVNVTGRCKVINLKPVGWVPERNNLFFSLNGFT